MHTFTTNPFSSNGQVDTTLIHDDMQDISLLNLQLIIITIIIRMDIFKAPTLRLKALNKRDTTHILYIEIETCRLNQQLTHNVHINTGSNITEFLIPINSGLLSKHQLPSNSWL